MEPAFIIKHYAGKVKYGVKVCHPAVPQQLLSLKASFQALQRCFGEDLAREKKRAWRGKCLVKSLATACEGKVVVVGMVFLFSPPFHTLGVWGRIEDVHWGSCCTPAVR